MNDGERVLAGEDARMTKGKRDHEKADRIVSAPLTAKNNLPRSLSFRSVR